LNGDVELDEAVGSSWTQLLAVDTSRGTDDARLLLDVEPEVSTALASATICCISFTSMYMVVRKKKRGSLFWTITLSFVYGDVIMVQPLREFTQFTQ